MKVLRFAQELDESGRSFYVEMAARSDHPGVRRIFQGLADEEDLLLQRHRALAALGDAIDAATLDRGVNVFEQLRRREEHFQVADDVTAYHLALDAEREVLQQYRSAAQAEEHPAVRKLLNRLARDEQRHVEDLQNLYDFANAPNHFLAWGEFSNLGEFHNFGRDLG